MFSAPAPLADWTIRIGMSARLDPSMSATRANTIDPFAGDGFTNVTNLLQVRRRLDVGPIDGRLDADAAEVHHAPIEIAQEWARREHMINVSEVLAILISAITQAEDRRCPASLRSSHRLLNDRVATVCDEQVRPEVLKDVVQQKENLLRFEPIGARSRFRLRHQHRDRNAIEHEINGRPSDDDVGGLLHRSHEGLRGRMALQRHIEFREVIVDAVRRLASNLAVPSTRHWWPPSASHCIRMRMLWAAPLVASV